VGSVVDGEIDEVERLAHLIYAAFCEVRGIKYRENWDYASPAQKDEHRAVARIVIERRENEP